MADLAVYVTDAWVPLPAFVESLAAAVTLSYVEIDHPTLGRVHVVPRAFPIAVAPDGAVDWSRVHGR